MPRKSPPTPRQAFIDYNDVAPTGAWTSHIDYRYATPESVIDPTRPNFGLPAYAEEAIEEALSEKEQAVFLAVLFEGLRGDELAHRFGHQHRWPIRRIYNRAVRKLQTYLEETA